MYVALSRATHPGNVFVCLDYSKRKAKNVVYPEVLFERKIDLQARTLQKSHAPSPLRNVVSSLINGKPQFKLWDDEFDSDSAYDAIEKYRDLKKRTDVNGSTELNKVSHRNYHLPNGFVIDFVIVRFNSISHLLLRYLCYENDMLILLQPKSWVIDTPISAFMQLITNDRVLAIDTLFTTSPYSSVSRGAIENHAYFQLRLYGRSFNEYLARLTVCEKVIIPIFNSNFKVVRGNNWGLAVLDKRSSTIRVYDSQHTSFLFENLLPSILQPSNSINSRFKLFNHEWPSR